MGTTNADEIRPFSINVPDEDLVDRRRRVAATRLPERETVTDAQSKPAMVAFSILSGSIRAMISTAITACCPLRGVFDERKPVVP